MRDKKMIAVAKHLLIQNLDLKTGERLLIIEDDSAPAIGDALFKAGDMIGAQTVLLRIQSLGKNGKEPPETAARAMEAADVIVAVTAHSITHTRARKKACEAGARIATMPGITEKMFCAGAIIADYDKVAARTDRLVELLNSAGEAVLVKEGYSLKMSLSGRQAVASTGIYRDRGKGGNLPSGEAYIAPVEGSGEGQVLVDGSFAGLGKLSEPLRLSFAGGRLTDIQGLEKEKLLALLGQNPLARNLAELGIGTNDRAQIIGTILEDEKAYGTVHIALGSNDTFGGNTAAGIHLDGVIIEPDLYLDGELVLRKGRLIGKENVR